VLADVERVDPDRLGEDRLLDGVADHLIAADRLAGRVDGDREERVETKFNFVRRHVCSALLSKARVDYHDGRIPLWWMTASP
jgi:hypothetical protein